MEETTTKDDYKQLLDNQQKILKKQDEITKLALLGSKAFYSLDEAALYTGYKPSYIYKLTCHHLIPFHKPNGQKLVFSRTELEEWMSGRSQISKEESNGN